MTAKTCILAPQREQTRGSTYKTFARSLAHAVRLSFAETEQSGLFSSGGPIRSDDCKG